MLIRKPAIPAAFGRRVEFTRPPSLSEALRVVAAFLASLFPELHRRPKPRVIHPAIARLESLKRVF